MAYVTWPPAATSPTITLSGDASGSGTTAIPVTLTNSAVIGKVLTGYVSGAGTVAATDTILQAVQKLDGNVALKMAVAGGAFSGGITGTTAGFSGAVTGSNLSGTNTGDQTITLTSEASGTGTSSFAVTLSNAAVIAKVLTGYVSGAGTIAATDTILQAIQKLNGNDGLKLNLTGGTISGNLSLANTGALFTQRVDVASTASITALTNAASFVKITGATGTTIHGITQGTDGQRLTILANGAAVTVKHQSATATGVNRIYCPGSVDVVLTGGSALSFDLIYDGGAGGWTLFNYKV